MIAIKLMGGLGNQMFQYAAALEISNSLKVPLLMDTSWFDSLGKDDTPRFYELGNFRLPQKFISTNQYYLKDSGLKEKLLKISKVQLKHYKEPSFSYDKNFENIKDNTLIEGYFQSEKYFCNIQEIIREEFSFEKKAGVMSEEVIKEVHKTESVSLHVRRGDYISNYNASKFHGLMGEEYYKRAISIFKKNLKNPKFFIFSDDIDWVKKNFSLPKSSVFVTHNNRGVEDLRIMIECKHNIIANSSFSWWGAWLGSHKDKKVIAPKRWFLEKSVNTSDIIPSRWQKI